MSVKLNKIFLFSITLFVVFIVTVATLIVRQSMCSGLNNSKLAVIQYAIGDYLSITPPPSEALPVYLKQKYPQIRVESNDIHDLYGTAVKYVIDKRDDGIFVGVHSAGKDKLWGTADDIKREGTVLLELGETGELNH